MSTPRAFGPFEENITFDGSNGTGKTSVSRMVAEELGWRPFNSGAIYRTLGYLCLDHNIDPSNLEGIEGIVTAYVPYITMEDGEVYLDKTKMNGQISTPQVRAFTPKIAKVRIVRDSIKPLQRKAAEEGKTVFEGRDMGTVICPEARLKVFLKVEPAVAAQRRLLEYQSKQISKTFHEVLEEVVERDREDEARSLSPLIAPEGALVIDTSHMNEVEVMREVLQRWRQLTK